MNPLPCALFSRTRLLWPASHMPPQACPATLEPLRIAVLPSMRVPTELATTKTPEPHLVETVNASTRVSKEPVTKTP